MASWIMNINFLLSLYYPAINLFYRGSIFKEGDINFIRVLYTSSSTSMVAIPNDNPLIWKAYSSEAVHKHLCDGPKRGYHWLITPTELKELSIKDPNLGVFAKANTTLEFVRVNNCSVENVVFKQGSPFTKKSQYIGCTGFPIQFLEEFHGVTCGSHNYIYNHDMILNLLRQRHTNLQESIKLLNSNDMIFKPIVTSAHTDELIIPIQHHLEKKSPDFSNIDFVSEDEKSNLSALLAEIKSPSTSLQVGILNFLAHK